MSSHHPNGVSITAGGPTVTAVLGPGQHSDVLVSELAARGMLHRVIRSWPDLAVDAAPEASAPLSRTYGFPAYGALVHTMWATWRRIPKRRSRRSPQAFLNALFDRIAERHIGTPELLIGWSQVSLRCLRAARQRGIVAVLEHPMLHVDTWQETMAEEYRRYAPDCSQYQGLFSRGMVRRMLSEYDAAHYIVVPSSVARESFLRAGVAQDRLVTLPLGVETRMFAGEPSASRDPLRVAYVGRLELLKGLPYLLEAWRDAALANASLTVAGPVLPEAAGLAKSATGLPGVTLTGPLTRPQVAALLRNTDIVVFPSVCDAFGLVILEAMASGCSVIATSRSGAPDIIADGVDGFVVPPRDAPSIRRRLEQLHSRPELRISMGRRAREKVMVRYSLAAYGERLSRACSALARHEAPHGEGREGELSVPTTSEHGS